MKRQSFTLFAMCFASSLVLGFGPLEKQTTAADELLAADRAFSTASAKTDLVAGFAPMFSDQVQMPLPSREWAIGKTKVLEALRSNPDNSTMRADWTPVRVGISADGQQGFTFGFMTLHRPDSTTIALKYMSYWVKEPKGWRVTAFKRARRPDGEVSLNMMAPSLPAKMVAPTTDPNVIAKLSASLAAAEQSFSDESQQIGIGAAFEKYGSGDAVNMGGGPGYTISAAEIAKGFGPPSPGSPVSWKSERVIVASSGDLGISIGMIRVNGDPAAPASPFFTIWHRASPNDPWRYIAE